MNTIITKMLYGKGSVTNALAAFALLGLIALDCTCKNGFDLSELANVDSNQPSTNDTPFGLDSSDDEMPNEELYSLTFLPIL